MFITQSKLFQDDLFAGLLVTLFLLVACFAFDIEAGRIKLDVFGAKLWAWADIFHESSVSTLDSLLTVSTFALDCTFRFDNFWTSLSDTACAGRIMVLVSFSVFDWRRDG